MRTWGGDRTGLMKIDTSYPCPDKPETPITAVTPALSITMGGTDMKGKHMRHLIVPALIKLKDTLKNFKREREHMRQDKDVYPLNQSKTTTKVNKRGRLE